MLSGKCYGTFQVDGQTTLGTTTLVGTTSTLSNIPSTGTPNVLQTKGYVVASGYKIPAGKSNQLLTADGSVVTADDFKSSLSLTLNNAGTAITPIYITGNKATECTIFAGNTSDGVVVVQSNNVDLPGTVRLFSSTAGSQMEATITVTGQQGDASFAFTAQDGATDCTTTISCNGGFYQTSDARKKENLRELDLDKCYELIDKCQTVLFDYKDGAKDQMGMIAQEVEEFFPEIVSTDDKGFKSLDYAKLTVIVLRVLKDLIKKVNDKVG